MVRLNVGVGEEASRARFWRGPCLFSIVDAALVSWAPSLPRIPQPHAVKHARPLGVPRLVAHRRRDGGCQGTGGHHTRSPGQTGPPEARGWRMEMAPRNVEPHRFVSMGPKLARSNQVMPIPMRCVAPKAEPLFEGGIIRHGERTRRSSAA